MFDRILNEIREKIREREYVMTIHADEEMNDDCLFIHDVERGILTGKIAERLKDKVTSEWKYRIIGQTVEGGDVEIIVKLSPTGKLVIITVYVAQADERRKQMRCDICGKEGVRTHKVARTYGRGKDIVVIENIPVVTCPHCGEGYMEAETLHEIERIKLHKASFVIKRTVPVVDFVTA